MIRSDSIAQTSSPNNMQMGSAQTGGSSGGPWLVNFGADFSSSDPPGFDPNGNVVVGTTSWGYLSGNPKVMGSSLFNYNTAYPQSGGQSNIQALVATACNSLSAKVRKKVCGY